MTYPLEMQTLPSSDINIVGHDQVYVSNCDTSPNRPKLYNEQHRGDAHLAEDYYSLLNRPSQDCTEPSQPCTRQVDQSNLNEVAPNIEVLPVPSFLDYGSVTDALQVCCPICLQSDDKLMIH